MSVPDRNSGQPILTTRKPSRELLHRLADNVRRARKARGFTQARLGATCGVSKSYISDIEQARVNATLATLEVLASGLACGEEALLLKTDDGADHWKPKPLTAETESLLLWIGETARVHRAARGYSRESFAEKIGVNTAYYGAVERGERNLQVGTLQKVAVGLGIRVSTLIEQAESELIDADVRGRP